MTISKSAAVSIINAQTSTQPLTNVKTVQQAIHLAAQLAFDAWLDATNASGKWSANQTDHSFESWYHTLEDPTTDCQTKFVVAQQVYQAYKLNLKLLN